MCLEKKHSDNTKDENARSTTRRGRRGGALAIRRDSEGARAESAIRTAGGHARRARGSGHNGLATQLFDPDVRNAGKVAPDPHGARRLWTVRRQTRPVHAVRENEPVRGHRQVF